MKDEIKSNDFAWDKSKGMDGLMWGSSRSLLNLNKYIVRRIVFIHAVAARLGNQSRTRFREYPQIIAVLKEDTAVPPVLI